MGLSISQFQGSFIQFSLSQVKHLLPWVGEGFYGICFISKVLNCQNQLLHDLKIT